MKKVAYQNEHRLGEFLLLMFFFQNPKQKIETLQVALR